MFVLVRGDRQIILNFHLLKRIGYQGTKFAVKAATKNIPYARGRTENDADVLAANSIMLNAISEKKTQLKQSSPIANQVRRCLLNLTDPRTSNELMNLLEVPELARQQRLY